MTCKNKFLLYIFLLYNISMETTKNELSPYSKIFFSKLSNYLDTKIYYFGSIQRNDYFPKSSDIDIDIFTNNEKSTMLKLQNYLNIKKSDIHKFVYKLTKNNRIVHGYKVKYNDEINNFSTEILVFNEIHKNDVLYEHNSKNILPFYISYLLILLKYTYYNLNLITSKNYINLKRKLLNGVYEKSNINFVIIESLR
jgi:hypothetical protein